MTIILKNETDDIMPEDSQKEESSGKTLTKELLIEHLNKIRRVLASFPNEVQPKNRAQRRKFDKIMNDYCNKKMIFAGDMDSEDIMNITKLLGRI